MAGRVVYFLIAGAAVAGGMLLQGDLKFGSDEDKIRVTQARIGGGEAKVDRRAERSVERRVAREKARQIEQREEAIEREVADAVEELVRAEGSLISARLDDNMPAAAIRQAEERRNAARDAVERLSDAGKAASADDRDALRESIRDSVRDAVRG